MSFSVFWFRQALIVLLQILLFYELDGHWLFYILLAPVAAKVQCQTCSVLSSPQGDNHILCPIVNMSFNLY